MVETPPDLRRTALGIDKFVLVIIAVHLAIAIPLAYHLNIWVDEASSLYASEHGFWNAFQNAAREQKQAPLYFWMLSVWREIDASIFFARLFSILCSIISLTLFAGLASRVLEKRGMVLAAAFFGLHPFLIWASLEIRVYALVILLTIVLIRFFLSGFWDPKKSGTQTSQYLIFLVTAIFGLYTNYYLGFLLAGLLAALLLGRRWVEAGRFVFLMAFAGAAFSPMAYEVVAEFISKTSGFQPERPPLEGVRIIWHHFLTFVFPTEIFPQAESSQISFFRVWVVRAAVVVIAGLIFLKRTLIRSLTVAFFAVVSVIMAFLLISYFLVGGDFIHIRHASVLFVPLIVFLASLVNDLWPESWVDLERSVQWSVVVLAAALFAYSISVLYPNMTKRGDWARVAAFITENEVPDQPIVLFESFDALALPYYYRGPNRILPDDNYFDFGLQGPFGAAESMARQNKFVISEIPTDSTSVWLVVNEFCINTDACQPLENHVMSNYTIELEKEFYLSKVYLLKKKSQ